MTDPEDFDPAADGPILEPAGVPVTYKSYCKRREAYGFTVMTEEQWNRWNDFINKRKPDDLL